MIVFLHNVNKHLKWVPEVSSQPSPLLFSKVQPFSALNKTQSLFQFEEHIYDLSNSSVKKTQKTKKTRGGFKPIILLR